MDAFRSIAGTESTEVFMRPHPQHAASVNNEKTKPCVKGPSLARTYVPKGLTPAEKILLAEGH